MKNSNVRVVKCSVSPSNFINYNLLYATGKIKGSEEVVGDAYDISVDKENHLIHFKVKVKKDA